MRDRRGTTAPDLPPALIGVLAAVPAGLELLFDADYKVMLLGLGYGVTWVLYEVARRMRAQTALLEAQTAAQTEARRKAAGGKPAGETDGAP